MFTYDNDNVRRRDRLLDEQSALQILRQGEYGILSMIEHRDESLGTYGIPVNYVWDGGQYLYIHCAQVGHKLECIQEFPMVAFTVVGHTHVISNKFATLYESVIIRGHMACNLPASERKHALTLLLDKYSPEDKEAGVKYAEKLFSRTEILRLDIKNVSGKAKHTDV